MTDFIKWTLETIREDNSMMWMEERRVDWTPLLLSRLRFILEGKVVLLISDDEREWFIDYFLKKINKNYSRPLLPFFALKSLYPAFDKANTKEDINLLEDMLSIAFPNGFFYFYIGKSIDKRSQIAKGHDDSYMWLFDEQAQNSFLLNISEEELPAKLIALYRLFDKSIDAVLFGKVGI